MKRTGLSFAGRRTFWQLFTARAVAEPAHEPVQADFDRLMVGLAQQGKRVVRLKGGDPLVFGRAGEEIDACAAAGIAVEVVPGITAAQGAAARLGLPLTDRARARRVRYITGHAKNGALPDDIDRQSLADPAATTAIYMPVKTIASLVARVCAAGLDPATPALAVACATRPGQQTIPASIGDLPGRLAEAALPGPLLVFVGRVCTRAERVFDKGDRQTANVA